MRRAAITMLVGVMALSLLALTLGGWYYSDELLVSPVPATQSDDVVVTDVDPDRGLVTLDVLAGDAAELPTVGLRSPGSLLVLDGAARRTDDGLVRSAALVAGEWPRPGTSAATDVETFVGTPGEVLGLPHDEIDVRGELGVLPAWRVIPAGGVEDGTWVVIVHGRDAQRSEGNRLLSMLDELGLPSLAISVRNDPGAATDSDGYGRFGDTEWKDLQAAVNHLVSAEGAQKLVLVGYSQGASIAMAFMRRSDHADKVTGAVFISPLVSLHETLMLQARARDIPEPIIPPLLSMTRWISSLRAGIRFDELEHHRHVDAMPDGVPVLITHGAADGYVPAEPSRWLADALGDDALYVEYPGAGHVREWNTDRTRFEDDFVSFLSEEIIAAR